MTALALAASCGFGAPSASPPDTAPTGDGPPVDGSTDAPPAATCLERWRDGTIAFGTPAQIAALSSPDVDRDPYLMPDERTIFFSTYRSGASNGDVYFATRLSVTAPFGTPVRRDDISSDDADTRFSMSSDELTSVFGSNRDVTQGNFDVWLATRMNKAAPFLFVQGGVSNINSGNDEHDPELSADGQRLYLAVGNPQRIAVSQRTSPIGQFGSAQELSALFSNTGDADPSLSPDERIILFSSRRDGGDADHHYATRADKNAAFGTPVIVPTINSNEDDGDPAVSADGCRLYFASDRSGNWELYVASMTP
jgi:Tol biopolymer transport system component